MDWHPIQGGVEYSKSLYATETRVKCRPDGPLGTELKNDCECFTFDPVAAIVGAKILT